MPVGWVLGVGGRGWVGAWRVACVCIGGGVFACGEVVAVAERKEHTSEDVVDVNADALEEAEKDAGGEGGGGENGGKQARCALHSPHPSPTTHSQQV